MYKIQQKSNTKPKIKTIKIIKIEKTKTKNHKTINYKNHKNRKNKHFFIVYKPNTTITILNV